MKLVDVLPERVARRLTVSESGCWVWGGSHSPSGYGYISSITGLDGVTRNVRAHRFVYELLVGPIPEGLTIDHLCRVRDCVNPAHLEPVTSRENTLRGNTLPAANAAKTHCPQGHGYTTENTYVTSMGRRMCRSCRRTHGIALRQRRYDRGLTAHGTPRRRKRRPS